MLICVINICSLFLAFFFYCIFDNTRKKNKTELVLVSFLNHTRIIELDTVGGTFHVETLLAHVNLRLDILKVMLLQTVLYCRWECSYSSTRNYCKLNFGLNRKICLIMVSKSFRLMRNALESLTWKKRKCWEEEVCTAALLSNRSLICSYVCKVVLCHVKND